MDVQPLLDAVTWWDGFAVAILYFAWLGIGWRIEHPGKRRPSVSVLMANYRRAWMRELVQREHRIFDAALLQNLREGSAFFASTCLIALGGVLTLASNVSPLQDLAAHLPGEPISALALQIRLLPVLLLLTSGFLRFVWANRLFGYFSVLIGSVPARRGDPREDHRAYQAAEINIRAAVNFNRGLRALYFALAALAWLLGPIPLAIAALATVWTLYEREFLSRPRKVSAENPPEDPNTTP